MNDRVGDSEGKEAFWAFAGVGLLFFSVMAGFALVLYAVRH